MTAAETVLHYFTEYHNVVSTDWSLNKVLKKNWFSCLKVPKNRDQTTKHKFASQRQTILLSRRNVWFTPHNTDGTMPYPQYAPSYT